MNHTASASSTLGPIDRNRYTYIRGPGDLGFDSLRAGNHSVIRCASELIERSNAGAVCPLISLYSLGDPHVTVTRTPEPEAAPAAPQAVVAYG